MDDLEEPESGEELELDLTSPDLALKTDQEPEEDGKEHEEDCQEGRGQNTFNDTEGGGGQFADPRKPGCLYTQSVDVTDCTDKGDGDGPDYDEADGKTPRDGGPDFSLIGVHGDVGPLDVLGHQLDTSFD